MKPTVYVETTIASYLTARPSRDLIIAARQRITRDWWTTSRERYELYSSEHMDGEASKGDPKTAAERLEALADLPRLKTTDAATVLAERLLDVGAIPVEAAEDALHVAIAVVNSIDYLVTWNMRHIANATMRHKIDDCCRESGYDPTIICTPGDLMED
jgi:predicted nucleic acid-binding protein